MVLKNIALFPFKCFCRSYTLGHFSDACSILNAWSLGNGWYIGSHDYDLCSWLGIFCLQELCDRKTDISSFSQHNDTHVRKLKLWMDEIKTFPFIGFLMQLHLPTFDCTVFSFCFAFCTQRLYINCL